MFSLVLFGSPLAIGLLKLHFVGSDDVKVELLDYSAHHQEPKKTWKSH